jgi:DinB superfamily
MSEPAGTHDVEVWLRGPLPDVIPELQPVVHSLMQVREEVAGVLPLPAEQLWTRPGGAASIGFHLLHLAGSLDRLLTYARGKTLNTAQRAALEAEAREEASRRPEDLVRLAIEAIDAAIVQVSATPLCTLDEAREVGRGRLPSTVLGLLFHAAEHAQRHSAQIITTRKVIG